MKLMPTKWVLLLWLLVFLKTGHTQEEETLPADFIEFLGSFNQDEALVLDETITDIEDSGAEQNEHMKEVEVTHELSTQ